VLVLYVSAVIHRSPLSRTQSFDSISGNLKGLLTLGAERLRPRDAFQCPDRRCRKTFIFSIRSFTMTSVPSSDPYVASASQLVVEIFVRSLPASIAFYTSIGFIFRSQHDSFAELSWEDHLLFLDERTNLPPLIPSAHPVCNVRVMVRDVDSWWEKATEVGANVWVPIADRFYGLRDFTVLDPDGVGVRFATRL